jgi:hypothetical protein
LITLKRYPKINQRLSCFFKKYFSILLLFVEVFMVADGHFVQASSKQQDELSPPCRRPTRNKCTGQYYYEREEDFEAKDVKEIITLLANKEQFNSEVFNDLENEDLYRVRAYFRNADLCVRIKEFSENAFEVNSTKKSLLGLGQIEFTIKFKVQGQSNPYTLLLLIDDKRALPVYFDTDGKIISTGVEKENKEEQEVSVSPFPVRVKKRSFSLSRFREDRLIKASSPNILKKKREKEEGPLNLQSTEPLSSPNRSRAETSFLSKSQKEQQTSSPSPQRKRMKDIGKSVSSHLNRTKQKVYKSPLPVRRANTPNIIRRSRSFPDLKAQQSFWKRSKVNSLKRRPVKELVEVFESYSGNGS